MSEGRRRRVQPDAGALEQEERQRALREDRLHGDRLSPRVPGRQDEEVGRDGGKPPGRE